ncbi:tetratricopeptide repeat protein [Luteimonas vadosa]|uniref:Tetratricopeptide repeat protein n=1 Tax=Luteimonas vadosa TaxID=1165507 RepID=A0ABP9DQX2_9GAMM
MQQPQQDLILDALRRGAADEALAAATDAVAAEPGDAQAHRLLAMAQRAAHQPEAARASMEQAITLAPDDADLHFARAGLLLDARDLDAAQAALAQSVELDPNQFGAYILQAQLALGRGDLGEAERVARLAARIAPDHPWLAAVEGTIALRRGDADAALAILAKASEQAPDDAQVRYALGFAYLAKQHFAFAEQAFRGVLETTPDATNLHGLIADLLRRQGRYAEAADELAPLLADERQATPGLRRFAGELELMAGRHENALPLLRESLAAQPRDPRTIQALVEAWRRNGDDEQARNTLDAALATTPEVDPLWRARLAFETIGSDEAEDLLARWAAASPDSTALLEAQMAQHVARGRDDDADATAARLVERDPGHGMAESRLVESKLRRDPAAAVAHIQDLIDRSQNEDGKQLLRTWLALAHDRAGNVAEATALWAAINAEQAASRLELPEAIAPREEWPEPGPVPGDARPVAFLVGAPGSMVERVAAVLAGGVTSFRGDRFGQAAPDDAFQNFNTPSRLASGEIDPASVVDGWRAQLPSRGVDDGEVIDWLPFWDNALLVALRDQLPHALLMVALRDPRDMLLEWLAYGAPMSYRIESPVVAAQWLLVQLSHIALLHEQDLIRHRLLRIDEQADDPPALARLLGEALNTTLPEPPAGAFGAQHFAPGRWRAYAEPLAEAFAILTPVARRLGYPED